MDIPRYLSWYDGSLCMAPRRTYTAYNPFGMYKSMKKSHTWR